MAARIGSLVPGQQLSTVGVPVDNRRDMARELMAAAFVAQLSAIAGVLEQIVVTGEKTTDKKASRDAVAARTPSSGDIQRALQALQKDNGLVVTGRFDEPTGVLLQRLGLIPTLSPTTTAPSTTTAPTTTTPPPTTTQTTTAKPATPPTQTPAPERKPVDTTARAQVRLAVEARDAQVKNQLTAKGFAAPLSTSKPLDRALDPARLMASLVAGGINAQQPTQALSTFQGLVGLPQTGQLDPRTLQALVATKLITPEAASTHASAATPSNAASSASSSNAPAAKASTTSAASAATARAVKETTSTTTGSGASTSAAMARATAAASPEAAREQARLESLLAQAAAVERGVQAMTGDPNALIGHGQEAGAATGLSGSGGSGGGADSDGQEAALLVDKRPAGLESSTGNQEAGDDDHADTDRGEAVAAGHDDDDDDDDGVEDGHHKVEKLSTQIAAALKEIHRLDDDTVPVHYSWDVTLYRPGVYADGQPAEALWHLVVERAHAFDAVWGTAVTAIATRLLVIEPDAEPPTLEEVLGALRQARVR